MGNMVPGNSFSAYPEQPGHASASALGNHHAMELLVGYNGKGNWKKTSTPEGLGGTKPTSSCLLEGSHGHGNRTNAGEQVYTAKLK